MSSLFTCVYTVIFLEQHYNIITLPTICSVNASNAACSFFLTANAAAIVKSAITAGDVVVSAVVVAVVGAVFF